ncbi:sigma-70 family RNA polymerase sigma factor [Rossellomorea vietnamensis]|uniref:Sigma-70 family RNA polymerase sigma factor n=1 Tax=Rossellomorea vietnamensis TaxID=218284 RepID=A0A5D4KDY5_9BACI|nr:sigma-70 family RNA polymerase sigma factor [Rossellomorea vietnamensis]TYR75567.1 sigma-70 family RNA polymerase sigma factor [Rossellomorea vietnamensis]
MRYHTATNQQLRVIISSDHTIPTDLLVGVVEEVLNRGQLDKLIADSIYSVIGRRQKTGRYEFEDLMQIGRREAFLASKKYRPDRGKTFTSFAFSVIKHEIIKYIVTQEAQKRDDSKTFRYEQLEEPIELPDYRTNIERYVVNKLYYQQMVNHPHLSDIQKKVIVMRLHDKSLQEIADVLHIKDCRNVSQIYLRGIKKLRRVGA